MDNLASIIGFTCGVIAVISGVYLVATSQDPVFLLVGFICAIGGGLGAGINARNLAG